MATIKSVHFMVGACTELLQSVVGNLYEDFQLLRKSPASTAWDNLDAKFNTSLQPFAGLKTLY